MWIRTGLFIGAPSPGSEDEFRELVDTVLARDLRNCPGVHSVRMLWAKRTQEGSPDIWCQIVMDFDGPEQIDAMLGSEERNLMRANAKRVLDLFEGTLVHIDYEVGGQT